MIITRTHLARRTILRGAGAAIALPLLDGMVPAFVPQRLSAAAPIRRFGAIYLGMGVNMKVWPQDTPGDLVMNQILQPLAPFRDRIAVFAGLDNEQAISNEGGQHPRAQAAWLTGCRAKKTDGPDIRLGTSLDQIIAREYEKETQLGSLELAIESADLGSNCAFGFSCAYNNTISWRTPTTPLPIEINPRNVFERLFGASDTTEPHARLRQLKMHASILDSVTGQVSGLNRGLGPRDKQKLAEYLDAVRDVERRIQKAEEQATKELPVVEQPAGVPASYADHAKLLFDLQLLAFQTDLTRVFSIVLAREFSTRGYPEIGVPDSHHPLTHHQNNPEKMGRLTKLNAFHVKAFAQFVAQLNATKESDGTLFDNTALLFGSGLSDGNLHVPRNLPTVLVSGKGLGVKGNRYLQYPAGTPLANFHVTLAGLMGVRIDHLGDSNGEIKELTGV